MKYMKLVFIVVLAFVLVSCEGSSPTNRLQGEVCERKNRSETWNEVQRS